MSSQERGDNRFQGEEVPHNTAMNFLGSLLREDENSLGNLSSRDQYILLAHSDVEQLSLRKLEERLGVSNVALGKIYNRTILTVWNSSDHEKQEEYPLDAVLASVKKLSQRKKDVSRETKARMSEADKRKKPKPMGHETKEAISQALIEKYKDPTTRTRFVTAGKKAQEPEAREKRQRTLMKKREQRLANQALRKNGYVIAGIDMFNWHYAVTNNLLDKPPQKSGLTQKDVARLKRYFSNRKGKPPKRLETLLDRLSIAVARRA